MNFKPKTITDWTLIGLACLVVLMLFAQEARSETVIGIHGGHWSKHWTSENVTNEEHEWIGVRINDFTFGHAYNSYRQEGFKGDLWYAGVIKDWTLWGNINRWQGSIIGRGSIGMMHGYTQFAGHDPQSDPQWFPYVTAGFYYQQPIDKTLKWEVGAVQFGDATLPSIGLEARF